MKTRTILALIGLAQLPVAASAQLYQDASSSTAVAVRDPARQASTDIDAVIYNPAGTALLEDGWHFSLTEHVKAQRIGMLNYEKTVTNSTREIVPSLQVALKKDRFALSVSFANEGGYGVWMKNDDIVLSELLTSVNNSLFSTIKGGFSLLAPSCNTNDKLVSRAMIDGNLYNLTCRLGLSYKVGSHWSAYLGIKTNYVTEKTSIKVNQFVGCWDGNTSTPNKYFTDLFKEYNTNVSDINNRATSVSAMAASLGINTSDLDNSISDFNDMATEVSALIQKMANTPTEVDLVNEKTSGYGISPVIGVDYKVGNFNFGAKYEFETKIHTSKGSRSLYIPSLISAGASWKATDKLTVVLGGNFSCQKVDKIYGGQQHLNLEDLDLYFNIPSETTGSGVSLNAQGSKLYKWDFSMSAEMSLTDCLALSLGYSYMINHFACKEQYAQSYPIGRADGIDVFCGGIKYKVTDNMQIDFGIRKEIQHGTNNDINSRQYVNVNQFQSLTAAAGINIKL